MQILRHEVVNGRALSDRHAVLDLSLALGRVQWEVTQLFFKLRSGSDRHETVASHLS